MKSQKFVLTVRYAPATAAFKVGKAVGGFLRYVQYRDHHEEAERARDVDGLLRYVAYRDVATPRGRLFDEHGIAGDRERRHLSDFIVRSIGGREQRSDDTERSRGRAYYQLIVSPEDSRGIDLRELTRAALAQLARDLPDGLPPWVAAEHRNTAHPHVHVILGARREVERGRFREVLITRPRLARMMEAVAREIERQRGERSVEMGRNATRLSRISQRSRRRRGLVRSQVRSVSRMAARLAVRYQREAEMAARTRGWMTPDRERMRGGNAWDR